MAVSDLMQVLQNLTPQERRDLVRGVRKQDLAKLSSMSGQELLRLVTDAPAPAAPKKPSRWFDRPLCGLSKEGKERLHDLEMQVRMPAASARADLKLFRYLKQLNKMRLTVPDFFRSDLSPREFYRSLTDFCRDNDIPEQLAQRLVPILVTYIQTGHMRPVLIVGEKGCGKTTAVRLLLEKALQLPVEVVKVPQTDGSHGLTGDNGSYQDADAGSLAKGRLRAGRLLLVYLFDEIDKASHNLTRASVDDQLLSITDESCDSVYDNYLGTTLVGLEHCPKFMTANDLQMVSPILADRCTVIRFPNADAARIKSIARKYADKQLSNELYSLIRFDYDLMDAHIDRLVRQDVTSLRQHQQMIEEVLEEALHVALSQPTEEIVPVTEAMFLAAEASLLGTSRHRTGFMR